MSFSNTVDNALLQQFLALYPNLYVALSTTDPQKSGAAITEPIGNGYTRMAVGDVTLTGSLITNDDEVVFPAAEGSWGTITYAAIFTASEGGTYLGSCLLTTPVPVTIGVVIRIPEENLMVLIG